MKEIFDFVGNHPFIAFFLCFLIALSIESMMGHVCYFVQIIRSGNKEEHKNEDVMSVAPLPTFDNDLIGKFKSDFYRLSDELDEGKNSMEYIVVYTCAPYTITITRKWLIEGDYILSPVDEYAIKKTKQFVLRLDDITYYEVVKKDMRYFPLDGKC